MLTAIIRKQECIGCNRCVPVCPVDAIVGTNKFLHTVLIADCIGCKLCVPACPVDCIDILELAEVTKTPINKRERAQRAKNRHVARIERLGRETTVALPDLTSQVAVQGMKDTINLAAKNAKWKNFKVFE